MAMLIIFNILFVGFVGFFITITILGENPKGKAFSILIGIVSVSIYLFISTKVDPTQTKFQEIVSNIMLFGPIALTIIIALLGYIFKKPSNIQENSTGTNNK